MTDPRFYTRMRAELDQLDADGLTKPERVLESPQGASVRVDGRSCLNLSANNYLGLADDPRVKAAAREAVSAAGAGFGSVRFICGTHELHKQLEQATADWLGYDDAILFAAAFDANGGLFEPLLGEEDAIVSDSLNHASIIDGVRLCRAQRYRFATSDMEDLEAQLRKARARGARTLLIATDGVFSMDGAIADLQAIADLADRYEALVMVDDCHATGVLGQGGRGSAAHCGAAGRIDILTGTYGKALGGAMGGFVAARAEVIDLLRQRARPYLFSNSLAPAICGAALEAIRIARSEEGDKLRAQLSANARLFRGELARLGFDLLPGEHPIIPVMLGEARLAAEMAQALLDAGVLVTGFSYPVVPRGAARIRTQVSAAHTAEDLGRAAAAFGEARAVVQASA